MALFNSADLLIGFGTSESHEFENSTVCVTKAGMVATLELNRPDKRNALSRSMTTAITQATSWLNAQTDVKVVSISGRGPSFCAGFDLATVDGEDDPQTVVDAVDALRQMITAIESINATTVAIIHGNCVGGGLLIALACDLRLSADDAKFWLPETDLAIPLACGGVPRLVREIGAARATELILLCREINAERAVSLGIVNETASSQALYELAATVISRLSDRPKIILRTTKQQVSAAASNLTPVDYAFTDAHLLHAALIDPEARKVRDKYISTIRRGT